MIFRLFLLAFLAIEASSERSFVPNDKLKEVEVLVVTKTSVGRQAIDKNSSFIESLGVIGLETGEKYVDHDFDHKARKLVLLSEDEDGGHVRVVEFDREDYTVVDESNAVNASSEYGSFISNGRVRFAGGDATSEATMLLLYSPLTEHSTTPKVTQAKCLALDNQLVVDTLSCKVTSFDVSTSPSRGLKLLEDIVAGDLRQFVVFSKPNGSVYFADLSEPENVLKMPSSDVQVRLAVDDASNKVWIGEIQDEKLTISNIDDLQIVRKFEVGIGHSPSEFLRLSVHNNVACVSVGGNDFREVVVVNLDRNVDDIDSKILTRFQVKDLVGATCISPSKNRKTESVLTEKIVESRNEPKKEDNGYIVLIAFGVALIFVGIVMAFCSAYLLYFKQRLAAFGRINQVWFSKERHSTLSGEDDDQFLLHSESLAKAGQLNPSYQVFQTEANVPAAPENQDDEMVA